MREKRVYTFLLLLFFITLPVLHAQTSTSPTATASDPSMISTQFDMTGFPQWARDLRRGEIIAFGSFPFAYFLTNFSYDSYRWATNSWNTQYAPWPIKSAAAIEPSQNEKLGVIGIAAGVAVVIALVDYGIVRYKRHRQENDINNLPAGTPIIISRPLSDDTPSGAGDGSENSTGGSSSTAKTPDSSKTGSP